MRDEDTFRLYKTTTTTTKLCTCKSSLFSHNSFSSPPVLLVKQKYVLFNGFHLLLYIRRFHACVKRNFGAARFFGCERVVMNFSYGSRVIEKEKFYAKAL